MPGTDSKPSPQASAMMSQDFEHQDEMMDEAPPQPPFESVFTLLTNTTTNTTVHPRIHYLFSDDDTSILSFPSNHDPSNRALVVDLAPAAATNPRRWEVSWAGSLSPTFAVTASTIGLQENEGDDGGLMLRVEGVEREPVDMKGGDVSLPSSGSGALGKEDVEGLAEEFRRRMGVLKKVVGEGERRREVVEKEMREQQREQELDDDDDGEDAVVDGRDEDVVEKTGREEKGKEVDRGDAHDGK